MTTLQQPTKWGCPIKLDENNNTLSNFITTPSRICGFLLDLMRLKFSTSDNIYHEKLRIYTYDPDPLKTHIKIEPGFDYLDTDNLADLQPGIIVNMGETQVLPIYNATSQSPLGMSNGFFNDVNDFISYGGSAVINAVSPGPLESLLLAEDIFIWLMFFSYNIQDDLQLSRFSVKLLKGPEKPDTTGKQIYISSVQIEWSVSMTFSTNIVAPTMSDTTTK